MNATTRWSMPLLLASLLLGGCHPSRHASVKGQAMGTTWCLQGAGVDETHRRLVQEHLDAREAVLSHWLPSSALSRFNSHTGTDWFAVPEELIQVIELAHRIAEDTEGALDITCAPLIDLWGFGRRQPAQTFTPPDDAAIAEALRDGGWRHLQWRSEPPALRKTHSKLRLNVAAVTEGFVLNELSARLRDQGLSDFLLELGGEMVASGHAPDGGPWRVGIQQPEAEMGNTLQNLPLASGQSLSTSGSYRQRFEHHGRFYSHLIDPRRGRPVEHRLISVSVFHENAGLADGYATALMVLGPEQGRVIAEKLGLRVLWIEQR